MIFTTCESSTTVITTLVICPALAIFRPLLAFFGSHINLPRPSCWTFSSTSSFVFFQAPFFSWPYLASSFQAVFQLFWLHLVSLALGLLAIHLVSPYICQRVISTRLRTSPCASSYGPSYLFRTCTHVQRRSGSGSI